jgi:hypothetical protein
VLERPRLGRSWNESGHGADIAEATLLTDFVEEVGE